MKKLDSIQTKEQIESAVYDCLGVIEAIRLTAAARKMPFKIRIGKLLNKADDLDLIALPRSSKTGPNHNLGLLL